MNADFYSLFTFPTKILFTWPSLQKNLGLIINILKAMGKQQRADVSLPVAVVSRTECPIGSFIEQTFIGCAQYTRLKF